MSNLCELLLPPLQFLTTIAVDGLRDSNPGIKPRSPTLQADALNSEPPGKSSISYKVYLNGKNKLQALFFRKTKLWKLYESNNELLTFLKCK